jgi:phage shock protein C
MTCAHCSKEIEPDSGFCRFCGAGVHGQARRRRLARIPVDGKIAGVCAGIAAYFDADVTLVRIAWIILSIVPGALIGGVIAYVAAWIVMPEAAAAERPLFAGKRLLRSESDRKVAGICGGVAEYLGIDSTLVRLGVVILAIYPGAIICGLIAYVIAWFIIPPGPALPLHQAASTA